MRTLLHDFALWLAMLPWSQYLLYSLLFWAVMIPAVLSVHRIRRLGQPPLVLLARVIAIACALACLALAAGAAYGIWLALPSNRASYKFDVFVQVAIIGLWLGFSAISPASRNSEPRRRELNRDAARYL